MLENKNTDIIMVCAKYGQIHIHMDLKGEKQKTTEQAWKNGNIWDSMWKENEDGISLYLY